MTTASTLGFMWIVFTACIGHAVVLIAAYKQIRRTLDLAKIGEQRQDEDLLASQHRRMVEFSKR